MGCVIGMSGVFLNRGKAVVEVGKNVASLLGFFVDLVLLASPVGELCALVVVFSLVDRFNSP